LNSSIYTLKRKHGTIERSVLISADSAITTTYRHLSLKLGGFMNLKQFDDSEMDLFRIWGWKVTGIKTEWV